MNIKNIINTIDETKSLKYIAQAYTELSSLKLKNIRSDVERNRAFLDEISTVYKTINLLAAQKQISLVTKTKKTVSVLLTSNYRFYGNVNNDLILYYLIQSSKYNSDRVVIGKTGQEYLNTMHYFHHFTQINFKSDLPSSQELRQLSELLKDYTQVIVYYAQMKSVLVQIPRSRDITEVAVNLLEKKIVHPKQELLNFIFEPDIKTVLNFFEGQIKNLLLEQTFLESELARTASRLVSMDQAQTNANEYIKKQKQLLNRTRQDYMNKSILELTSHLVERVDVVD